MGDFWGVLGFMAIPITISLALSLVIPAYGTILMVRNELLIALSLPSAAGAAIALIAFTGTTDSPAGRIVPAVILLMILYGFLLNRPLSPIKRQAVLAGVLIGSQVITRFVIALKPSLESEFRELLNGEILAVGMIDLGAAMVVATLGLIVLAVRFAAIRLFAIDEESLRRFPMLVSTPHLVRIAVISLVTVGVVTIGPLLTTTLIVLAPLLSDSGKNGFRSAVVRSVVIAVVAVVVGFPAALVVNFPPAYAVSAAVIVVGSVVKRV